MSTRRISALALAELLGVNPPTPEQQEIIESDLTSAVIIAGAGSGKTTVISLRVVWLVANGRVTADRVLGLTFTRKAVGELNERVRSMLALYRRAVAAAPQDLPGLELPVISTYNAYAASLVSDYGVEIGLETGEGVLDAAARQELVDGVLDAAVTSEVVEDKARSTMADWMMQMLGEMGEHLVGFEEVEQHLGESVDALCTPEFLRGLAKSVRMRRTAAYADKEAKRQYSAQLTDAADALEAAGRGPGRADALALARPLLEAHEQKVVPQLEAKRRVLGLARAYAAAKAESGGMEFSDQVAYAHRIMTRSGTALGAERSRWDVVLLDEYQDTSYSQLLLLRTLFARSPVMAVGDPRQAIYGWRGASADSITSFPASFRGPQDVPAAKYGLMTSWRNDESILAAANRIALGLDSDDERKGLVSRPGAGPGQVVISLTHSAVHTGAGAGPDRADGAEPESARTSAAGVAEDAQVPDAGPSQLEELVSWVLSVREELLEENARRSRAQGLGALPDPSIAVLCRSRSVFGHVAAALEGSGLAVDSLGMRGLLEDPFVKDVLAAVEVLVDPDAGNVLMRLLTGRVLRLGAADVRAFAEFVRTRTVTMPAPVGSDGTTEEQIGVIEGLESLLHANETRPGRSGAAEGTAAQAPHSPQLTAEGLRRLLSLARSLRRLRSAGLTLTGLVRAAVRELGIDTEIAALPPEHQRVHERQLDELLAVVAGYAGSHPAGDPRDFLEWLRAMDESDDLSESSREPAPGAVTLMTIHASKGLEFDAVAVPFMHAGGLPGALRSTRGWLAGGSLPYPLRGDRSKLPDFDLRTMALESPADLESRLASDGELRRALDEHHRRDERRLAYVALTRARKRLFLSASAHTLGRTAPVEDFPFLTEVAEQMGVELPELPEAGPTAEEEAAAAVWPSADPAAQVEERRERRAVLSRAQRDPQELSELAEAASEPFVSALAARALVLLEEEQAATAALQLPPRLSATALVGLSADAQRWWEDQRRPMPEPPSVGAELGTAFHAWVESHYGQAALLDMDAGEGAPRLPGSAQETFAALQRTFLASRYAESVPVAVELSFELVLERGEGRPGIHVPGKIDAVFRDADGTVSIVDWKTGRRPTDPARLRHMELQLAVYRAALMRMPAFADAPRVEGEFYFVGSDETWRAAGLMDDAELGRWLDDAESDSLLSAPRGRTRRSPAAPS